MGKQVINIKTTPKALNSSSTLGSPTTCLATSTHNSGDVIVYVTALQVYSRVLKM